MYRTQPDRAARLVPVNAFVQPKTGDGMLHRDNHGLQLARDLPPGEYELVGSGVLVAGTRSAPPRDGADGEPLGDHAVLGIVTVQISAG